MVAITGAKKFIGLALGIILILLGFHLLLSLFGVNMPFKFLTALSKISLLAWFLLLSSIFLNLRGQLVRRAKINGTSLNSLSSEFF